MGCQLQYAVERGPGPEPPIEPEHELVQVRLEVLGTDAVMGSEEPRIEVRENDVDHRQVLVCLGLIAADVHGFVPESELLQFVVAGPTVGSDQRARLDVLGDEAFERGLATVWDGLKAKTSGDHSPAMAPAVAP